MHLFTRSTEPLKITLLMSLACVLDVMRGTNRLAQTKLFDWQIYTPNNQTAVLTCGIGIQPDAPLTPQLQGDLLLIIAGFNSEQHYDKSLLRQLHSLISRFRLIGGIEAGSWVLARMGLLANKKATTHWEDLEDFALRYPNVQVMPDRYVLDGNIFTTGGASPSFDFMLQLIRSRYGQQLALEVASIFIYDTVHTGHDAQPLVSLGLLTQQEPRIAAAIRVMSEHLDDPLSMGQLATQLQLSLRMLEYLFREHLHCSPTQYYLHLRLQSARRLVIDTHLSIQEIALRTGFSSLASLSRSFRAAYQFSPAHYRRRFKQGMA